jgi:hypothetical protein
VTVHVFCTSYTTNRRPACLPHYPVARGSRHKDCCYSVECAVIRLKAGLPDQESVKYSTRELECCAADVPPLLVHPERCALCERKDKLIPSCIPGMQKNARCVFTVFSIPVTTFSHDVHNSVCPSPRDSVDFSSGQHHQEV